MPERHPPKVNPQVGPQGEMQDAFVKYREKGQRRIDAIAADLTAKELLECPKASWSIGVCLNVPKT